MTGRGDDLAHAGPGGVDQQRLDLAEAVDDLGLAAVEQRRQDAVGDDGRRVDAGLGVSRSSRSSVSVTGISSGVVTTTTPVARGSSRMSSIHSVWSRTRPTCTSSLITRGAAIWATMCPLASASTTTRS